MSADETYPRFVEQPDQQAVATESRLESGDGSESNPYVFRELTAIQTAIDLLNTRKEEGTLVTYLRWFDDQTITIEYNPESEEWEVLGGLGYVNKQFLQLLNQPNQQAVATESRLESGDGSKDNPYVFRELTAIQTAIDLLNTRKEEGTLVTYLRWFDVESDDLTMKIEYHPQDNTWAVTGGIEFVRNRFLQLLNSTD